ncbi:spiroplasma phage ORF1-like family protein [Spiroplasma endosymbiont of Ammophila pubescens]|uniref:spiroplasma phage ORF1-like family protein n=1 Tax=Spiroplasma endosymbiont of Ammophila pubescens TaxID=3066315 RepID=UPI0032B1125A
MKKLLSILGAIGLTATSTTNLVACDKPKPNNNSENGNNKPEPNKPQEPPVESNWKLVNNFKENLQKEINVKNNKWYIAIGRNKRGNPLYNSVVKFNSKWDVLTVSGNISFGNDNYYSLKDIKSIYRWDGTNEPQTPDVDKDTGKIIDWKE